MRRSRVVPGSHESPPLLRSTEPLANVIGHAHFADASSNRCLIARCDAESGDQRILRGEARIKNAVSEAGFGHDHCDSHAVLTVAPDGVCGGLQNPIAGLLFMLSVVTHG